MTSEHAGAGRATSRLQGAAHVPGSAHAGVRVPLFVIHYAHAIAHDRDRWTFTVQSLKRVPRDCMLHRFTPAQSTWLAKVAYPPV